MVELSNASQQNIGSYLTNHPVHIHSKNHQLLHEPDRYHVTALHAAAEKGHARAAEEMLYWGAREVGGGEALLHCRDDNEMTPLHLAAQRGRVE